MPMINHLNNIKRHLTFPSQTLNPICTAIRLFTFPELFHVYVKECFHSPPHKQIKPTPNQIQAHTALPVTKTCFLILTVISCIHAEECTRQKKKKKTSVQTNSEVHTHVTTSESKKQPLRSSMWVLPNHQIVPTAGNATLAFQDDFLACPHNVTIIISTSKEYVQFVCVRVASQPFMNGTVLYGLGFQVIHLS